MGRKLCSTEDKLTHKQDHQHSFIDIVIFNWTDVFPLLHISVYLTQS